MISAIGISLPAGVIHRQILSGESQTISILSAEHESEGNFNVITRYPDGHIRHHQVQDVATLIGLITLQLKNRYNLDSFTFTSLPQTLEASEITIGEIVYVP